MVMIGGITRLTESGLSITEWKPVTGFLPPLNEIQWAREFELYQASPEYNKVNIGMNLEEFKSIFWLEFIHRLVGRTVGLVFFLPLIYFWRKKQISSVFAAKLFGIFSLGGLQGVIGWYMVKSGLKDIPYVSHYWLAFHLSTAFVIFAMLFFIALGRQLSNRSLPKSSSIIRRISIIVTIAIFIQVILGAFVAGLHAGMVYNTFPLMDGRFIPTGLFELTPWYRNLGENVTTVQFEHRIWAFCVVGLIVYLLFLARKNQISGLPFKFICSLVVMVIIQFSLGVATLLNAVPVPLASIHQMGALVLFALSLCVNCVLCAPNDEVVNVSNV